MTDAGTTQDNFILPVPPVGGLPISQDWLNTMKLIRNCTIPIILPCGKNILVDTMFKMTYYNGRKEGNVLFNDTLNTFYLLLYGVGHMVKDHSDSERGNPLPPHGLLFPISSKGSFIWTIP